MTSHKSHGYTVHNPPPGCVVRPTEMLSPGDIVIGTGAGDIYPTPRVVVTLTPNREASHRMTAYTIEWDNGSNIYYGDTPLYVQAEQP